MPFSSLPFQSRRDIDAIAHQIAVGPARPRRPNECRLNSMRFSGETPALRSIIALWTSIAIARRQRRCGTR